MADHLIHIEQIGQRLVQCSKRCRGVRCNQILGYLPHCLFTELQSRTGSGGSAIVGLNPGHSTEAERKAYKMGGCSYQSTIDWFTTITHDVPYYRRLRNLVDSLALSGPILWTELAKCESKWQGRKDLPLQTFRTCVDSFLQHELAPLPRNWPLVAVGRQAYMALAYRFHDRTVIGVPHPTGSRGQFSKLMNGEHLKARVAERARRIISNQGTADWLS